LTARPAAAGCIARPKRANSDRVRAEGVPMSDDAVQAACIRAAAALLAQRVYPSPTNVDALDEVTADLAARIYRRFRSKLPAPSEAAPDREG
jgi:hypothetical protein